MVEAISGRLPVVLAALLLSETVPVIVLSSAEAVMGASGSPFCSSGSLLGTHSRDYNSITLYKFISMQNKIEIQTFA